MILAETRRKRNHAEHTRVYSVEDARAFLSGQGFDVNALAREVEDKLEAPVFVGGALLAAPVGVASDSPPIVALPISNDTIGFTRQNVLCTQEIRS